MEKIMEKLRELHVDKHVEKTEYMRKGADLIAYVHAEVPTSACAELEGKEIKAISNLREPFDARLHIFPMKEEELRRAGRFTVHLKGVIHKDYAADIVIEFDEGSIVDPETAAVRPDRHLSFREVLEEGEAEGVVWSIRDYRTPGGDPVIVYVLKADPEKVRFIAGTPDGETAFTPKHIKTVMEECEAQEKAGETVLAASNADFFDMFGNCRPSGLCVHKGICVANPDTENPFFAVTKEGRPVIGRLSEYPLETLEEALGGGQVILREGKPCELALLENFGEVAHPRTAFGITEDGHVIVMVVDGRRPSWSNGAALIELVGLMKEQGAVIAMNTDGGGSSTMIVRKAEGLEMINHPADLFRPMEDLVRPLYDSLIIVKK
ncbi:MAG: phosphodiester glycosidase family protein [Clostridia bacterium]|nr:phosphodiester glycosidase family protein [Clostridia bacterium]